MEVKLWFWSVDTSLALVVILTFSIGALVGILFSFSGKKKKPTTGQSPDEVPLQVTPDPSQQEGGDPEFEDVI